MRSLLTGAWSATLDPVDVAGAEAALGWTEGRGGDCRGGWAGRRGGDCRGGWAGCCSLVGGCSEDGPGAEGQGLKVWGLLLWTGTGSMRS